MGNLINLPNITFDSLVVENQEKTSTKKTSTSETKQSWDIINERLRGRFL